MKMMMLITCMAGCSDGEDEIDDLNDTSLIPKRISCFAHILQLCVKDG